MKRRTSFAAGSPVGNTKDDKQGNKGPRGWEREKKQKEIERGRKKKKYESDSRDSSPGR